MAVWKKNCGRPMKKWPVRCGIGLAEKKLALSPDQKRQLIDPDHAMLRIHQQCALVGLSRSAYYYTPAPEAPENLQLMRLLDAQSLVMPFYGSRRMTVWLNEQGYAD